MRKITLSVIILIICYPAETQQLKNPVSSFENCWQAYEDNYAFFSCDSIDWLKQHEIYRNRVTQNTTEEDLIGILSDIIRPLNDGHSFILKGDEFKYFTRSTCWFSKEFPKRRIDSFREASNSTLFNNGFDDIIKKGELEKGEPLYSYSTSEDFGYIQIRRFYGSKQALFDDKIQEEDSLRAILDFDSILSLMHEKQGLIIDIRNNGGGNLWCFDIASRLNYLQTVVLYKNTRQKGDYENFSETEIRIPKSSVGLAYTKPVVILTNCKTASAAELFLLSVKDLPHITIVGSNTKGKLSNSMNYIIDEELDIWGALSNERVYDSDRNCYERTGIPPDILLRNKALDLEDNTDPLIVKAIQILENRIKD